MRRRSKFLLPYALCSILYALPLHADPPDKGFYNGPYITFSGGAARINWDINQRINMQEGRSIQPFFHLGFGWNILDWFAPELNIRFGTDKNGGRREYFAGANLGFNFILLAKPLLNFESLRILPFLKPGFVFQGASLPGDTTANDNRLTMLGFGGGMGGGVRFLYNEYLYFGVEMEQDWILYEDKNQLLTSGATTLIYPGGWKRQMEGIVMVGVHF